MQTTKIDVIVVGSGASGGWAAKRLSEAGIKVALLEAGKPQSDKDFTEHVPVYDLKYRDKQGYMSATACILANHSMTLGRSLHWDHAKGIVVGDAEANRLLRRTYRGPWLHPDPASI